MASELQGCTCLHPQVHSHVWLLHGRWGSELGLSCLYSKLLRCRASSLLPNCVCVCKHYLKTCSQTFWVILHCGVFELLLLIRWSGLEEKQSKVRVCLRWTVLVTLDMSAESFGCFGLSGYAVIIHSRVEELILDPNHHCPLVRKLYGNVEVMKSECKNFTIIEVTVWEIVKSCNLYYPIAFYIFSRQKF